MSRVFETTTIRNMTLPNRFVRSATWEGMAAGDGSVTPQLIDLSADLARGGVGLIITGHAWVSPEGRASRGQLGAYSDALIPGLAEMARAVHGAGGKIALQLAHAGCRAAFDVTGIEPVGPSPFQDDRGWPARQMQGEDFSAVAGAFAAAAVRARTAGYDAVQIHGAHGYLLSQFLSPFFNKRTDGYGGSVTNRTRAVLEVYRAIREAAGDDFPVMIKINSEDYLEGGLTVDDMLKVSALLETAGMDVIEMSGGTGSSAGKYTSFRPGRLESEADEVYYKEAARRYKEQVRVPLMLVGGIRSFAVSERLVAEGMADYIALCRPLIREPGLINRWKSGDLRRADCLDDNGCFKPAREGKGLYCVVKEKAGKE